MCGGALISNQTGSVLQCQQLAVTCSKLLWLQHQSQASCYALVLPAASLDSHLFGYRFKQRPMLATLNPLIQFRRKEYLRVFVGGMSILVTIRTDNLSSNDVCDSTVILC
jgi:hypothetical protein